MTTSDTPRLWNRFSIRTLLLAMTGASMLCLLLVRPLTHVEAHFLIVFAFMVPGASMGWDIRQDSRGMAIGGCVAAVLGSALLSAGVLAMDFLGG